MNKKPNILNKIIVFTLLGLMLIPILQKSFLFINEKPLLGDVVVVSDVSLSVKGWFSGDYASQKEKYLNDNFGFRNFFVRLRNQFYFSLFRKVFAKDVVCGKEGYLYEIKYLKTFSGQDYIGEEKINQIYSKLKFIQDTLEKKGKTIVVLFAPGKATYYPEFIPVPFNISTKETNYLKSVEYAKRLAVNYFDFNKLFVDLKNKTRYPLYPQTGTHWSVYGMHLAFDKLSDYLEKVLGKKMLKYDFSKVVLSDSLRHPDGDIANGINLFNELPHFTMAYPEITWGDTTSTFRPKVMTVSDSYWMGLYFLGLPEKVYCNHEFWYYNKQLYNYSPDGKVGSVWDVDLNESIEKNDVIFIMATEASLKNIGWGFIDELYNLYKKGPLEYERFKKDRKRNAEISQIKNNILNDEDWYSSIRIQAREKNISLDSCIQLNAEYFYNMQHQNETDIKEYEISKIIDAIYQNSEWYNSIVKQAKEKNLNLDTCIYLNAEYTYNERHRKENPQQPTKNTYKERIEFYKNAIRNNKEWLQALEKDAKAKNLSIDSVINQNAIWMVKQEH